MGDALSRRQALVGIGSAVAAAALPAIPALAWPAAAVSAPVGALFGKAWVVGTPGEWDYQFIRAETDEEAMRYLAEEATGEEACFCADMRIKSNRPGKSCEFCCKLGSYEARRVEALDDKAIPTDADWLRVELGTHCSRCGYEAYPEEGACVVGEEAVCDSCMALSDWDLVDPERAAEMRAEADDEGLVASLSAPSGSGEPSNV